MKKHFSIDDLFWPAFVLCALLSLALLWSVKYLPQVDLPQHAAQVKLWRLLEDPAFEYGAEYEWNRFSPYLSCYFAGRLLSIVLPVRIAMKLFVTLTLLALPCVMFQVLRTTGGDRWWALSGFALAFSFDFYWGFLNFLAAIPIGLLLIAWAFPFARRPTSRGGAWLACLGMVLFLTHGLVCGFTLLVAGVVILVLSPNLRAAVVGQIPLLPAALLGIVWFLATRLSEAHAAEPPVWNLSWRRLLELPGTLLGSGLDIEAQSMGALLLLVLLTGLRAGNGTVRESVARWVPVGLALGFFLLGPEEFFHAAFLNSRFAVFIVPLVLFAMGSKPTRDFQRCLLMVLVVGWLLTLYPRFKNFDRDAQGFDSLLVAMEPHRRVLGIMFEPFPEGFDAPCLMHHHAWYQAEKGGYVEFSFAYFYGLPIRYRKGREPQVTEDFPWHPESFDPMVHGGYDYYVVHSSVDPGKLFREDLEVVLRVHSEHWWLYEKVH